MPVFEDFSDEISGDFNKCDFLILYNEMCQLLEDMHNSVHQYIPNDHYNA